MRNRIKLGMDRVGNITKDLPLGQRSLTGYSPWGHKESDITEGLSTHAHVYVHNNNLLIENLCL